VEFLSFMMMKMVVSHGVDDRCVMAVCQYGFNPFTAGFGSNRTKITTPFGCYMTVFCSFYLGISHCGARFKWCLILKFGLVVKVLMRTVKHDVGGVGGGKVLMVSKAQ